MRRAAGRGRRGGAGGPGGRAVAALRILALTVGAAILAASLACCTLLANADLKRGIGETCATNDDCQASLCDRGTCSSACGGDPDCPVGSLCLDARCRVGCRVDADCEADRVCVDQTCAPSLKIGAVFTGKTNGDDGWSTTNRIGLDEATAQLRNARFEGAPYAARDDLRGVETMHEAIDQFLAEGAKAIVTTSPTGASEALAAAPQWPGVVFINAGASSSGGLPNVGAYDARAEQAWYAAGRLAAREAESGNACIGMILPAPTKRLIRETNAFARGARFQQGGVKVVIRWVGSTRDFRVDPKDHYTPQTYATPQTFVPLYREELLAAQLADLGCTVIAHRTETQRVVGFVENRLRGPFEAARQQSLFSMGVDVRDACRANVSIDGDWLSSCLGTVYWGWGPLYTKLLDQVQRGTWTGGVDLEAFHADPSALVQIATSPFTTLTGITVDDTQHTVQAAADAGYDAVFTGPYAFTGQRDRDRDGLPDPAQVVAVGEKLSDDELGRMCWFVQGLFELPDAGDVRYETLVPALVPYGPPVASGTTTLNVASDADRKKYGDVIDYLHEIGQEPSVAMSCALH